jgi:hypothetical protein
MSDRSAVPPASAPPPGLIDRLLLAHPRTVGESYAEHAGIATRFGATMVVGGVKCLIHAVLPSVFERAASDCVTRLNGELTRRRAASAESYPDYVI